MPQSYPDCPIEEHRQHADTTIRRGGLHGREETYQRWECVPGNGDAPHYFAPILPQQRVVGRDGWCPECLRPWDVGEGVPIAKGHSYTIRDMAAGLVRLGEGQSYRQAAAYVRRRAGKSPSRDGRLVRDWVVQYAPVLREHHLPDEWPEIIVVDHTTFRRRAWDEDGNLIPRGEPAFHVMGALSYGSGTLEEAQRPRATGRLWLLRADTQSNEAAWNRFFEQLEGQPQQVVCDRDAALWAALQNRWPSAELFPCTWHLYPCAIHDGAVVTIDPEERAFIEKPPRSPYVEGVKATPQTETTGALSWVTPNLRSFVPRSTARSAASRARIVSARTGARCWPARRCTGRAWTDG